LNQNRVNILVFLPLCCQQSNYNLVHNETLNFYKLPQQPPRPPPLKGHSCLYLMVWPVLKNLWAWLRSNSKGAWLEGNGAPNVPGFQPAALHTTTYNWDDVRGHLWPRLLGGRGHLIVEDSFVVSNLRSMRPLLRLPPLLYRPRPHH
jgi:hypothetical protein